MCEKRIGKACFNQSVQFEKLIFFSNYIENGLCCMELNSNSARLIELFPNESLEEINLFSGIHLYDSQLFFVPSKAKNIVGYDLRNKTFSEYSIEELYKDVGWFSDRHKFECSYLIGDALYMIGCTFPGILKFNLLSKKISYLGFEQQGDFEEGYFYKGSLKDGFIWCACMSHPKVLKLNTANDSISIIDIQTKASGFSSLILLNEFIYLTGRGNVSNVIVKYNMSTGETKEIQFEQKEHLLNPLGEIVSHGDELYFFPEADSHIYHLDNDDKLQIVELADSVLEDHSSFTIGCRNIGKHIGFFTTETQMFHEIDPTNGSLDSKEICLMARDSICRKKIVSAMERDGIVNEGKYSVEDFIASIIEI